MRDNYITEAKQMISAGLARLVASDDNIITLADALRAAHEGRVQESRVILAHLGLNSR